MSLKLQTLYFSVLCHLQLSVSHEMQFADAFTLQVVLDEDLTNCYYVLGMVPFLQKLVRDVSLM